MNCRFCNKEMELLLEMKEDNKTVTQWKCECGATIKQARMVR